jgi:hypothetical protein
MKPKLYRIPYANRKARHAEHVPGLAVCHLRYVLHDIHPNVGNDVPW